MGLSFPYTLYRLACIILGRNSQQSLDFSFFKKKKCTKKEQVFRKDFCTEDMWSYWMLKTICRDRQSETFSYMSYIQA